MKKYYNLCVDKENGEADLYIFGDITSWRWLESDVSSYSLSKELESLSNDVKNINVYINSCGGEVSEALAIRSQLKRHKAKVKTYCDGIAASAAVTIFMAGDERIMSNASLLFIHNAWTSARGNSEDFRKQADDLEKITQQSINACMEHVNISEEELKEMMNSEKWIDPAEALEMGFCTSIEGEKNNQGVSQSAKKIVYNKLKTKETRKQEHKQNEPIPTKQSSGMINFIKNL
ncbi:head maturation protease, ClpP-related [uncultured Eubacterium sp.]|uniref:head maturation protease, ClpP-related n=1 Tax=uncultured Eubacterium sp. TaxID=165185 RepID=UPI0026725693|nr:head maturation protease, ClpP-related [uncultured Eubacterium sp.]